MSQITCKNQGFTLAEVLIVIAIIGVVSVIIFPMFMQDMSERMFSNRDANIAQKITKSVEVMTVNGGYENFTSTEAFVNNLRKYLKIAKVCDSNHLTDCWPAKVVTAADGNKYEVKNIKTGTQLHTNTTTNTVGLVLADGANIIMTYNPTISAPSSAASFTPYKKRLPVGNGKFEEFAYSSNATSAIDYVVDLNGSGGPNAEVDNDGKYYDIRSFRIARFSNADASCESKGGFKVNGVCVVVLGTNYNPISCADTSKNAEYCTPYTNGSPFDYYGGGRKACADLGLSMPSAAVIIGLFQTDNDNLSSLNRDVYFTTTFISNQPSGACYTAGTAADGSTCSNKKWYLKRSDKHPVLCVGS